MAKSSAIQALQTAESAEQKKQAVVILKENKKKLDGAKEKILSLKSTQHQKDLTVLYLEAVTLIGDAIETCDLDTVKAKQMR